MRILVVKKGSSASALIDNSSAAQLKVLAQHNPHLDLKKLAPGAVILVPDDVGAIDFPGGDPKSVAFEAMESFIDHSKEALAAGAKRMKLGAERAKTEEAALAAAMKSKGVKAALDKDPGLQALATAASQQAKDDVSTAASQVKAFDALAKAAQDELAALAKRLA
jgi:hypothetical protein